MTRTELPRSAEVRDRIVAAAAAEFAERGFDGAGVDEIARRAGVNKAMLYYHVGDKRELFSAVMGLGVGTVRAEITAGLAAAKTHEERLAAIPLAIARTVQKLPFLPHVMMREIAGGGANLPAEGLARIAALMATTRQVLADGAADGAFRSVNPVLTHLVLVGGVMFMAVATRMRERIGPLEGIREDVQLTPESMAEHLVNIVMHGVAAGPPTGE